MEKVICGIKTEITRKNVKYVRITVDRRGGKVRVSIPLLTPLSTAEAFVCEKKEWIEKKLLDTTPELSKEEKELYREKLKAELPPLVSKWETIMGLSANKIFIRDSKTRWGSCNGLTHNVSFSLYLAEKSVEQIEYVIVHELAHIKYPNHSKQFYAFVARFVPDYKAVRKELNKSQR